MTKDTQVSTYYLGIDPTTKGIAYTVLRSRKKNAIPEHVESGKIEKGSVPHFISAVKSLLERCNPTRIGLEIPGQYGKIGFEGAYLPITMIWAGIFIGVVNGVPKVTKKRKIFLFPAQVNKKNAKGAGWRYYLLGGKKRLNRIAWDNLIKDFLISEEDPLILDYPKRSNKDVRDSSVIAAMLRRAYIKKELDTLGCIQTEEYHGYIVASRKKN